MQSAAGEGASVPSHGRNESYLAIVSDLVSLIERVQESLKLVEAALASDRLAGDHDLSADVVVLDDVTPCYSGALGALTASNAVLQRALDYLLENCTSVQRMERPDQGVRRSVRSGPRA